MIDSYISAFGVGMAVWFLTWGLNRIYLLFKSLVS